MAKIDDLTAIATRISTALTAIAAAVQPGSLPAADVATLESSLTAIAVQAEAIVASLTPPAPPTT